MALLVVGMKTIGYAMPETRLQPNPPPRLSRSLMSRTRDSAQAFWPHRSTLGLIHERFRDDKLGVTAGSLTFTTIIGLVPLITVMLALFAAFPVFSQFQGSLQKYFLQSLVPDGIAKPVLAALTQFSSKASRLGTVGLVGLGVTAFMLVFTIDRTLNAIWRVRRPRSVARRVLIYWAALTLGPVVVGASLTLTSYAVSASRGLVTAIPGGLGVMLSTLEWLLLVGGLTGLFQILPNAQVRWKHALMGALFAACGLEIAKKALAFYVEIVPTYSVVYGAFATLPILLLWIYLVWVIVLVGAEVAACAPTLALNLQPRPLLAGSRFADAVAVLRVLAQARRTVGVGGSSVDDLAENLRLDPLRVEEALAALARLDWVGRLEDDDRHRQVILVEPMVTSATPLIDLLLLADDPQLAVFRLRSGFSRLRLDELLA
jgi:membrane protein